MDEKMLGWQRPHGQAGIITIMVRQNGVASDFWLPGQWSYPPGQKQGSALVEAGLVVERPWVSGTRPRRDSQRSSFSSSWT